MKKRSLRTVSRRGFLKNGGACIALPFLESLQTHAAPPTSMASPSKRLVCIGVALGMHPGYWTPTTNGKDYQLSPLLEPLASLKNEFSILSGLSHPSVKGGHKGAPALLSGVYKPERIGKSIVIRNNITFDQVVAKKIGQSTRYDSLQLSSSSDSSNDSLLSWNDKGVSLQPEGRARVIFEKLFLDNKNPHTIKESLNARSSILDLVMSDTKELKTLVSHEDSLRLDEYTDSIRDVEKRIQKNRDWLNTPKPKVKRPNLVSSSYHGNLDVILELTAMAIETNSCPVFTVDLPGGGLPIITKGLQVSNYHGQSHHGKDPSVVEELVKIEMEHMKSLSKFLNRLKSIKEGDKTLLDNTHVLFSSGLGNGSSHSNKNLPILLAGGGLKHGYHHTFEEGQPMTNLFVSIMQSIGLGIESFSDSTGNFNELFI